MEAFNTSILFLFGIGVLGGILGALLFRRLKTPEVVGYIVIGLVIGQSGFHLVREQDLIAMGTFNLFALGLIGFQVGGEIKIETFRKYAKQFSLILLGEGLLAFSFVCIPITIALYKITGNFAASLAGGVVFGSIASATDPASTMNVLWENRSKGILTTSIIAIVALDDALAMTLYAIGTSFAHYLLSGSVSIRHEFVKVGLEIFGSIFLGLIVGIILNWLLRWIPEKEKNLALALAVILLTISVSVKFQMDVILAAMTLGFVVVNFAPRRSKELFDVVRNFSIPIYIMFFVLIGAKLDLSQMPGWLWLVVGLYVIGRGLGKVAGAHLGGKLSDSPRVVQNNLGLGLFSQGGVAVGLSIMASQHLPEFLLTDSISLGDAIVTVVTATTLLAQLTGPPLVKLAVHLAGEVGCNVTEDDIIKSLRVSHMMKTDVSTVRAQDSVDKVVQDFVNLDYPVLPVVDDNNKLLGTLSLNELKDILNEQDTWQWIVAEDVMSKVTFVVEPSTPIKDAVDNMRNMGIGQAQVVDNKKTEKLVGLFDLHTYRHQLQKELIERHKPKRVS